MQRLRRYASYVAVLVFLTSGPVGALHVASELGGGSAPVSTDTSVRHTHTPDTQPDRGCVACHLLQHVRVPEQAGTVLGADAQPGARQLPPDAHPPLFALVAQLPARAPPAPALA